MKLKGDKNGLYILGIVAIVAVVGMLIFFTKSLTSSTEIGKAVSTESVYDEEGNVVGEAAYPMRSVRLKTATISKVITADKTLPSIFFTYQAMDGISDLTVWDKSKISNVEMNMNISGTMTLINLDCMNGNNLGSEQHSGYLGIEMGWFCERRVNTPSGKKTIIIKATDEYGNIASITRNFAS